MIGTGEDRKIEIAPMPDMIRYLDLLHKALVTIRACGFSNDKELATFSAYVADALHNLPHQLLSYGEFDQAEFWRYVRALRTQVPPRLAPHWDALFPEALEGEG